MEQSPDNLELAEDQPEQAPEASPVLSPNQVLIIFLASLAIGVVAVLAGIVPLIAVAMLGPIVAAMLA